MKITRKYNFSEADLIAEITAVSNVNNCDVQIVFNSKTNEYNAFIIDKT